jgi:hypothetical protein
MTTLRTGNGEDDNSNGKCKCKGKCNGIAVRI